tara:strand:- start:905 stop:1690 length:786 start_codon:yes stop_codon:yes gene_type:complete
MMRKTNVHTLLLKNVNDVESFTFSINAEKIPTYFRTEYLMATDMVRRLYAYPQSRCVWKPEYHEAQQKIIDTNVDDPLFHNRAKWLYKMAKQESFRRQIQIQTQSSTPWSLIKMEIMKATYDTMIHKDQSLLLSQTDITGAKLNICGVYPNSSQSHILKMLQPAYNTRTKEGFKKNVIGWTEPEFRTNAKKLFYSRTRHRAEFCAAQVFYEALKIADWIYAHGDKESEKWLFEWEHTLGHDFELIDYVLHQKKRDSLPETN